MVLLSQLIMGIAHGQDRRPFENTGMFFPAEMDTGRWQMSAGFITITTPEDITEEVRVRAPAGDLHALYKLGSGFYLDGRMLIQFVQNHLSVGARWVAPLNDHLHVGIGDDVAYWRGHLDVGGFDTKASGWLNYPSLSLGFRSGRDLLFTLKAELIITTSRAAVIEGNKMEYDVDLLSGPQISLYMEQPFYKKKYLTLGFTMAYADFMWATWPLFETFDRALPYPQITTSFIL